MSYAQNKREWLIEWISKIDNDSLLDLLNSIRLSQENTKTDWWEELSRDDQRNIQLGIDDYLKGEVIASEEFWRRLRNE